MTRAERFPTMTDPVAEAELADRGWTVVDILTPAEVEALTAITDDVYVDERAGFHASNMSDAHAYRRAVDQQVRPLLADCVARQGILADHESFTASLLVKWPTEDSAFHTHQDWNMVDESRYRTVNVWCPLVDTDEGNGAFAALPGSHKVLRAIRCSPMPPRSYRSPGWEVSYEDMVKVSVRAGQAVVFDHALLHSSPPNRGTTWRPAVAAAFKPREAALVHYYLPDPDGDVLEVYEVDSAFFTDFDIGDRPDRALVGQARFQPDELDRNELLRACGVEVAEPEPEPEPGPEPATEAVGEHEPEPESEHRPELDPQHHPEPGTDQVDQDRAEPAARTLTPYERLQIVGSRPKRWLVARLRS